MAHNTHLHMYEFFFFFNFLVYIMLEFFWDVVFGEGLSTVGVRVCGCVCACDDCCCVCCSCCSHFFYTLSYFGEVLSVSSVF